MRFIEYTAREQWERPRGGLLSGELSEEINWASLMAHSGHAWVNVPSIWWLGLGMLLFNLPGMLTTSDCW